MVCEWSYGIEPTNITGAFLQPSPNSLEIATVGESSCQRVAGQRSNHVQYIWTMLMINIHVCTTDYIYWSISSKAENPLPCSILAVCPKHFQHTKNIHMFQAINLHCLRKLGWIFPVPDGLARSFPSPRIQVSSRTTSRINLAETTALATRQQIGLFGKISVENPMIFMGKSMVSG